MCGGFVAIVKTIEIVDEVKVKVGLWLVDTASNSLSAEKSGLFEIQRHDDGTVCCLQPYVI